jgi:hypothetical protein
MWSSEAVYTSDISGISNQEFVTNFETDFNFAPEYQGAAAYASGEILTAAIEKADSFDMTQIAQVIGDANSGAGWSTIMSSTPLTFPAANGHRASGSWVTYQYNTASETYVVTGTNAATSNLIYPMPSWAERVTASMPTASPNGYSKDDDDSYSSDQAIGMTLTAIFCFLGGVIVAVLLMGFVPQCRDSLSVSKPSSSQFPSSSAPSADETEMVKQESVNPVHNSA